jgi:hypothetical protein
MRTLYVIFLLSLITGSLYYAMRMDLHENLETLHFDSNTPCSQFCAKVGRHGAYRCQSFNKKAARCLGMQNKPTKVSCYYNNNKQCVAY